MASHTIYYILDKMNLMIKSATHDRHKIIARYLTLADRKIIRLLLSNGHDDSLKYAVYYALTTISHNYEKKFGTKIINKERIHFDHE